MALFTRGNILEAMLREEKQKGTLRNGDNKDDSSNDSSDESSSEVAANAPKIPAISDIGATFFYNDHKRSDFRMQHALRVTCDSYKLENNEDRRRILILKPSAAPQLNEDGTPEDITAYSNFEQDIDYVSRLCENQAIGFSLDDIMTALYGHVLKPGNKGENAVPNRRRGRKSSNAVEDNPRDAEDDAERSNDPSVCYFKRLAQTATYTGLSVSRLAPIAASSYNKSEAITINTLSRHGKDHDFEKDEAEALKKTLNEARNARRAIKANIRVLPVHFLPQFLITQRVSVQKANNCLALCFNLLRDMERFSRAFSNNRLYLYTVQQLRANFTHVISDVNFRAICATEVIHQMGQWERERQQMREQFHRMGKVLGIVVDTLTVTDEDVTSVFLKQIAPKLAHSIDTATGKINTALLKIETSLSLLNTSYGEVTQSTQPSRLAGNKKRSLEDDIDHSIVTHDETPLKRQHLEDDYNNKISTTGTLPQLLTTKSDFVGWSNATQVVDTGDIDLISLNEEDGDEGDMMITDNNNLNVSALETAAAAAASSEGVEAGEEILEDLI